MGLVYRIERQIGEYSFLISNTYTNEKYQVTIDPDKVHLWHCMKGQTSAEACPFLYMAPLGAEASCIVHQSRPDVCREVFCCRILAIDPSGRRAGRVMGSRHFQPETPEIEALWENKIRTLPEIDDAAWDEEVVRILAGAGYTVRR